MADTSLYDTLGVRPGASEAEIRKVRWLCLKNGVKRMPIRIFQILPPMCVSSASSTCHVLHTY